MHDLMMRFKRSTGAPQVSPPATAEQTKSEPSRLRTEAGESPLLLTDEHRTTQEITAALSAIPVDSVTARTAGVLRVSGPRRTIAQERTAFEQAVAEENARPTVG